MQTCVTICVHIHLSFSASGIKLCTAGCPAALAWVCLQVQSKRAQIHVPATVFSHKDKTTMHKLSQRHAAGTFKVLEAISYWPFKSLGQVQEQIFMARDPCITGGATHVQKALNFVGKKRRY